MSMTRAIVRKSGKLLIFSSLIMIFYVIINCPYIWQVWPKTKWLREMFNPIIPLVSTVVGGVFV